MFSRESRIIPVPRRPGPEIPGPVIPAPESPEPDEDKPSQPAAADSGGLRPDQITLYPTPGRSDPRTRPFRR